MELSIVSHRGGRTETGTALRARRPVPPRRDTTSGVMCSIDKCTLVGYFPNVSYVNSLALLLLATGLGCSGTVIIDDRKTPQGPGVGGDTGHSAPPTTEQEEPGAIGQSEHHCVPLDTAMEWEKVGSRIVDVSYLPSIGSHLVLSETETGGSLLKEVADSGAVHEVHGSEGLGTPIAIAANDNASLVWLTTKNTDGRLHYRGLPWGSNLGTVYDVTEDDGELGLFRVHALREASGGSYVAVNEHIVAVAEENIVKGYPVEVAGGVWPWSHWEGGGGLLTLGGTEVRWLRVDEAGLLELGRVEGVFGRWRYKESSDTVFVTDLGEVISTASGKLILGKRLFGPVPPSFGFPDAYLQLAEHHVLGTGLSATGIVFSCIDIRTSEALQREEVLPLELGSRIELLTRMNDQRISLLIGQELYTSNLPFEVN